ncbi:sulfurtransferase TusA family protein [Rhodospirillum rubrum]|uniref:UPF0033 domain-containing protein n=1 Tax=Rhodospirillum rubrum (strain ATCC 11170 / ATH 1.1.1 / DSM 467 / LMG 4362 / NCIMB 8255 / S1) TaxID=269796 RepID=Q2RMT6_RHORT|nr:sulfurtransferase TusA family protein [Rhodospirillum rubrum]ABC24559.1 hypothetical protein Rru_A3765 [Rhodospirillum rubrum ATCC 11170]AEO50312.1 hypothetical protein F11_19260 [Rhodospirillum rubrum F11]MBK5956291.1 SirA family protein [Rhodospirillum rubrum]QXG80474.1 sulfurtransferase TusA family protein [Rhodospirillum rubrum]HAQ01099.1 sulfurtransferase TusA family protein [Rhodospirillum rubrum]
MDRPAAPKTHEIDITGEVCPMTFVRTKLLIERAHSGDLVAVRLKGTEPLKNVPRSARALGHHVLSLERESGEGEFGVHRLVIQKA